MLPQNDRAKVDELRGTPMTVGTLEEIIDDNHAIVSSPTSGEHYVGIMSFVNKDLLELGCSVLLHNKVMMISSAFFGNYLFEHSSQTSAVIGVLADDADPMVNVMKVEKAPLESYADIGGLEDQVRRNYTTVAHTIP